MGRATGMVILIAALTVSGGVVHADGLTIYDVQYTIDPSGDSDFNGQIHSVTGGIVTKIFQGSRPRVYLQNPEYATWGAIVVKDWEGGELANNVHVGDWVRLSNVLVEEYRGGTHLQYNRDWAPDVAFSIDSSDNDLPTPAALTAADLAVPVDHAASEPYESMLARLENVTVGTLGWGKAEDNYELTQGDDVAWGTDYMNIDAGGPYDPHIYFGAYLDSITGIVEQYTKPEDGWDYFQLCTRDADDIVPEPGTAVLLLVSLAFTRRRTA
ncbi:MAG: hypothetical protein ABIG44_02185 [Planctomycetota bacterium]